MNKGAFNLINLVLVIIIVLISIVAYNMNERITELELDSNYELSNVRFTLSDYESLIEKVDVLDRKLGKYKILNENLVARVMDIEEIGTPEYILKEIDDKLNLLEKYNKDISAIKMQLETFDIYDLQMIANDLRSTNYIVNILKDIIYSRDEYSIIVGKADKKISDNVYEIISEIDGEKVVEQVTISSECQTYVVGQYRMESEELEVFIEHILFYEYEDSTLIIIDNEVRYMFQGTHF